MPNVPSVILAKVIEFCKYHKDAEKKPVEETKAWDREFIDVDHGTIFEVILAANYLNIQPLLDLSTRKVADMIKGKTPEQIRSIFNISNDFTKEEENEVRRENQWAYA